MVKSQPNPGARSVEKDIQVLNEVAGPKTSNRKRFFGFLSVLGLGMAVLEVARFLYVRQPAHAVMACIWLAVGVSWGYRFLHFGESRVTRSDVKVPK